MTVKRPTKTSLGLRACALAVLLASAGSAGAVSLQQAYELALKNDPQFRMNFYDSEAAKENKIIGRSYLLPNVSASFSGSRNIADQESVGVGLFGPYDTITQPRYISRSTVVQLRQPILNLDGIARYRQGKVMAEQGEAELDSGKDQVALRVVGAYVDVLFAEDQMALSRVSRDMYAEQQKVNQRMFEKGEGTKTDMLETQAKLDLAEAQLVEAQDNVVEKRSTLEGVIGQDPGSLDHLSDGFHVGALKTASFEDWRVLALANNPDLKGARLAVENARLEISKNRAGHAPRIDMIASWSKGDSETLNTAGTSSVNRAIGVQVNIPIYSGGAISASTRQAADGYEKAKADLDARTNKVVVEVRSAHNVVTSAARKVEALDKAVASGKELMKATEQSIKGGVRINLDLLNAQQQLYVSQRDLAQARYNYLIGVLRLRAATGIIGQTDIREIAAYFH
jgi:protease secretion system outer membrane protein